MAAYECRGCGVVVSSNGRPDECPACGGRSGNRPEWYRFDDPAELFD